MAAASADAAPVAVALPVPVLQRGRSADTVDAAIDAIVNSALAEAADGEGGEGGGGDPDAAWDLDFEAEARALQAELAALRGGGGLG